MWEEVSRGSRDSQPLICRHDAAVSISVSAVNHNSEQQKMRKKSKKTVANFGNRLYYISVYVTAEVLRDISRRI